MDNFFESEVFLNIYLTCTEKLLFIILKNCGVHLSNATLSLLTNSSQKTVSKSLSSLKKLKYINIEIRYNTFRTISINENYLKIYKPLSDLLKCSKFPTEREITKIIEKIFKKYKIEFTIKDKKENIKIKEPIKSKESIKTKEHIVEKPIVKEEVKSTQNKSTGAVKINRPFIVNRPTKRTLDSIKSSFDKEFKNKKSKSMKSGKLTLTNEEREIIDYWYSLGLTKYNETSKTNKSFDNMVRTLRRVLKGSFYRSINDLAEFNFKPSMDDLKSSIKKFSLATLNPNYKPIGDFKEFLRKINLGSFLFNPFGKTPQTRSFFLYYLSYEPEYVDGIQYENFDQAIQRWKGLNVILRNPKPEDISAKRERILKWFGENYLKSIVNKFKELSRLHTSHKFSVEHQTCFIRAVEHLADFIEKNHKKLKWKAWWFFGTSWEEMPWNLVKAAQEHMYNDQKFEPKLLLDSNLYNWKFMKYIKSLGWIEKDSEQQEIEENFGRVETINLQDYVDGKDSQVSFIAPKKKDPTKNFF